MLSDQLFPSKVETYGQLIELLVNASSIGSMGRGGGLLGIVLPLSVSKVSSVCIEHLMLRCV